jgi:hypothetical protein
MRVITPFGICQVDNSEFRNGNPEQFISIQTEKNPKEQHLITKKDVALFSPNGVIRIIQFPSTEIVGNLQFHEQGATVASIFEHERPANESLLTLNRIDRAVQISDGVWLEGIIILMPWVGRWGELEFYHNLSLVNAVAKIHELEDKTSGTSVGISSLVAIDTTARKLLYLSLWCPAGINRFSYHDEFPE